MAQQTKKGSLFCLEFVSLNLSNLNDATAISGQKENSLGGRGSILGSVISPINHSDTNQSHESVSSCMWKKGR